MQFSGGFVMSEQYSFQTEQKFGLFSVYPVKQLDIKITEGCPMNILNLIFAIFLPPVGVYLQVGLTTHFWINLALTLAGYLPGVIHAIWLVVTEQKGN